jgi:glycogen(starch) synthase
MLDWTGGRPIFITTDPIGGVWTYTIDLVHELACAGIDVALASMGRPLKETERVQVRKLPGVQLYESDFKLEWMSEPWDDVVAAGAWLRKLTDSLKPSLIHLNQLSHGALDWNAPCLVVGHSCVYSWFRAVKGYAPDASWRDYHRMVSLGLHGADCVTAPSRWMLAELKEIYGDFIPAEAIYNGRRAPARSAGSKGEYILTAGRLWDEGKNVAVLEQVAPKLPWPIFAAGETTNPNRRRTPIANLRLLGPIEPTALAAWMEHASIFVLPARYEPFGLTAVEAALASCALVLGDIPSLREVWQDAALFVAPDNTDALGAVLAALIVDSKRRIELAQRARRRAATFTPERMARDYIALYRQMVSRSERHQRDRTERSTPLPRQATP